MTLRLVHKAREGQERTRPRGGALTAEEHQNLGATIRHLSRGRAGMKRLARETGVPGPTLQGATKLRRGWGSASLALAVSRAAGCSVEDVLSGKLLPKVEHCPTCGAERRAS